MQAAFVIGIALAGLGCQNKTNDLSDVPPVFSSTGSTETKPDSTETKPGTIEAKQDTAETKPGGNMPDPYPRYTIPSSYSGTYQRSHNEDVSDVYPTHWDVMRSTLCSFVLGRDPELNTAAEIEASVYGDYPGN
jgi:hypothetical protein